MPSDNNKLYRGQIHLILGPMYSGKTSELIRRYDRYTIGGRKCMMIKYKNDTRYDNESVVTHNGTTLKSYVANHLSELDSKAQKYDAIFVDEVQFYQDAPIFCDKWANEGKTVVCCGLNGNFKREPFQIVSRLIPMIDDLTYLRAICEETGNEAPFTHRFTEEQDDEVIGGKDKYHAVDRQTYFRHNPGSAELRFLEFVNLYTKEHHMEITNDLKVKFMRYFGQQKRPYDYPKILKDCFVGLDEQARMLEDL